MCRQYQPRPVSDLTTVPIIPSSYCQPLLLQYHSQPSAGHLGPEKTAARLRQVRYWVGMLHDIDQYCRKCSVCQSSKPPSPQKAPLLVCQLEDLGKWLQWTSWKFHCHVARIITFSSSRIILVSGQMLLHYQTRQLITQQRS